MNSRPLRICIVAVHTYPVINPRADGAFGGIETRSWCFARELARLPGTEVNFVVTHRSAPRRSIVDGVTVVEVTDAIEWFHQDISEARKAWCKSGRIPWAQLPGLAVKLLTWSIARPFRQAQESRWQTPAGCLTNLDADVYVGFGVNAQSDWTLISAKSIGRPFVLCLASEFDVDQRYRDQKQFVNPYGVTSAIASHLITSSNGIVAQNRRQQDLLQQIWNRASERIENPLDIPRWDAAGNCPLPGITPATPFVLWIGRADRFHKRPLEMLRVARQNPGISFVMVMNPGDSDVHDDVHSAKPTNVTIIPQVPFEQMSALMRSASLFASTSSSSHEGLPNVFLQAAASKVPILSLETSADWLAASGSGLCFQGDVEAFSRAIAEFSAQRNSPDVCRYAESGRAYVEREHDAIRQASRLLEYLRGVVDAHPSVTSSPKR